MSYIHRTANFGSSNATSALLSMWVKKTKNDILQGLFLGWTNSSNYATCYVNNDDTIYYKEKNGGTQYETRITSSTRKFIDNNAWYHFVFQSHNNNGQRGNVYIDGQLDPSLTEIDITDWNLASGQYITIGGYDAGIHGFHGYMANVHLIDGQALLPSDFAETVDGVLVPKQYEGTYGNIGFHFDFAPENMEYSGDTITRVLDESPNSNHWYAH